MLNEHNHMVRSCSLKREELRRAHLLIPAKVVSIFSFVVKVSGRGMFYRGRIAETDRSSY